MKSLFILLVFSLALASGFSQTTNAKYDSTLAKKLGADDYGMKSYVMVILKTGTNTSTNQPFIDSCFGGHMANIKRMVEMGKLIIAGPFGKNEDSFRGIFILNVTSFDDANELLKGDPAIKEKLLEPVLYKWYGSAALPEYLPASDKVWKKGF
jgi:uncharacterized protein YciI